MDNNCNICGSNTSEIVVKEQMLGLGEVFTYLQCQDCGHTYLVDVPDDMGKYYPKNDYYSFKKKNSFLKSAAFKAVSKLKINKDSVILDYGCGGGSFVNELISNGFKNTKGYDLYLPNDMFSEGYLTSDITNIINYRWNVITLNHVFEHLASPLDVLRVLRTQIQPNGILILRFPVIDSFAFKKYRENWVQFDAPRHINLFTRKSFQLLIEQSGVFKIADMYDDSNHFGFTGSELYLKGLSLKGNSFIKRVLSYKTYKYALLAKKLNKENRGDQIVVILHKI